MKKWQGFGGDELRRQLDAIVTVTPPSQSKKSERGPRTVGEKVYQDKRPRDETETLIKNMIRDAGEGLTFNQIARGLNRSTSPHLRSILVDMVKREELVETIDDAPRNPKMTRSWYSLP